ncbi:MAG: hypothetical protein JJU02_09495 [Cryomorphaceae bacterium]|nr:hypothetical protein [Cryomorphaceae bacterium]
MSPETLGKTIQQSIDDLRKVYAFGRFWKAEKVMLLYPSPNARRKPTIHAQITSTRFIASMPNAAPRPRLQRKARRTKRQWTPADKRDGRSALTAAATTAVLDEDLQRKARLGAKKIIVKIR